MRSLRFRYRWTGASRRPCGCQLYDPCYATEGLTRGPPVRHFTALGEGQSRPRFVSVASIRRRRAAGTAGRMVIIREGLMPRPKPSSRAQEPAVAEGLVRPA